MAAAGFWLRCDEDPAQAPIHLHGGQDAGIMLWLSAGGTYLYEPPISQDRSA